VGVAALAGCSGRDGADSSSNETAGETASPADATGTGTSAATDTPTGGALRLSPADLPAGGPSSSTRRRLAVAAITDDIDGRAFYPETELGEWGRTEFFENTDHLLTHAAVLSVSVEQK
jgi:hypothetical protein